MAEGSGTKPKQPKKIHAQRLVKILEHIAECLGVRDITDMYTALTLTVKSSKESDFRKNLHNFTKLLIFKPGVPANLLIQAVRGILIIKKHPELVHLIYDKLIKKFPSFAIIMEEQDDKSFRTYLEALLEGIERTRHIRLMVVGMFDVGKTCLIKRICNESIEDVESTDAIDVSLNACKVNENGSWDIRETSQKNTEYGKRLANIEIEKRKGNDNQDSGNDEGMGMPQSESPPAPESQKKEIIEEAKHTFKNLHETDHPGITKFKQDVGQLPSTVREKTTETENLTGRETTVSIWDFAGQSIYYSTHHFFLSPRSIYLLVIDISKPLDEKVSSSDDKRLKKEKNLLLHGCLPIGFSRGDAFRFWINSIYTYTRGEIRKGDTDKQRSNIVLVATHKDCLSDEDDIDKKKDEFFRKALGHFGKEHPALKLICDKWFLVSCTEDAANVFDDLKNYIHNIAIKQDFWEEPTPASRIPLERTLVAHGSPFIKFTELEKMNKKTELPLKTKEEIKSFLEFQHLLGNVLYYNVQNLDETIVLDPQWIIDIFKMFITHQAKIKTPELESAWETYRKKAILSPELIQYMWKKKEIKDVAFQEVIEFMKHLDVMANPVTDKGDEQKENFFIVPCMLQKLTREDANNERMKKILKPENAITTSVLCFVFENGFLPPSVFHRLLASCIREWEVFSVDGDHGYLLYEGFGVFKLDKLRILTIWYAEYVIYMRIILFSTPEMTVADYCKPVKDNIIQMLHNILLLDRQKRSAVKDRDFSLLFNEYILCEKKLKQSIDILFKTASKIGLHKVAELKEYSGDTCGCSGYGIHEVKAHDLLKYWYPLPSDRDLAELSDYVGEEFRKLGSLLKLSQETLKEIEENSRYTYRTKAYKILIEARNQKNCTYDDLKKEIEKLKQ